MKNIDEQKLIDYILGEVTEKESKQIQEYIANNPKAQEFVKEYCQLTGQISEVFENEVLPQKPKVSFSWRLTQGLSLVASILIICVISINHFKEPVIVKDDNLHRKDK